MEEGVEVGLEVVLVAEVPREDGLVEAGLADRALHRWPRPHPLLRGRGQRQGDGRWIGWQFNEEMMARAFALTTMALKV